MVITTIDGKPVLKQNRVTLGTFTTESQAIQAKNEVEPILQKDKTISVIPVIISVIERNGGR